MTLPLRGVVGTGGDRLGPSWGVLPRTLVPAAESRGGCHQLFVDDGIGAGKLFLFCFVLLRVSEALEKGESVKTLLGLGVGENHKTDKQLRDNWRTAPSHCYLCVFRVSILFKKTQREL